MTLVLEIIVLVFFSSIAFWFVRAFYRGAPFAPTSKKGVEMMVRLATVQPTDRAVDIGSGDGRLVIALAKAGARETIGIEINPVLAIIARWRISALGLSNKTKVIRANLWKTDFSKFTVVTLFGIPYIMHDLEIKLLFELPKGARVIANQFKFPNWEIEKSDGNIHLYIKK